jgi:hypothetical protein
VFLAVCSRLSHFAGKGFAVLYYYRLIERIHNNMGTCKQNHLSLSVSSELFFCHECCGNNLVVYKDDRKKKVSRCNNVHSTDLIVCQSCGAEYTGEEISELLDLVLQDMLLEYSDTTPSGILPAHSKEQKFSLVQTEYLNVQYSFG